MPFKLEIEYSGNTSLLLLNICVKAAKYYFLHIILSSEYQTVVSANTEVLIHSYKKRERFFFLLVRKQEVITVSNGNDVYQ